MYKYKSIVQIMTLFVVENGSLDNLNIIYFLDIAKKKLTIVLME
jgi:hypothetical protein